MFKPAAASFALAAAGLIAAASLHARVDETVVTVANRAARSSCRHLDWRTAVHVVHLPEVSGKTSAVPNPLRGRGGGDPRVSARAQTGRTRGSSAPRGPLVQLRGRERVQLLGSFVRDAGGEPAEDGHDRPQGDRTHHHGEEPGRADSQRRLGRARLDSAARRTRFIFSGAARRRAIDRITTWTAADKPVTFNDTKEGAFGIRVARALEQPSTEKETFVGADGKKEAARLDNTGVTGATPGAMGKRVTTCGEHGAPGWV